MGETVPVGYRFHPTDEELVGHFLKYKLQGDDSRVHNIIAEVDVCKFEPWDLPAFSKVKSNDPEWFFFSPRDLKYTNSNRCNRATPAGYWKATGKERSIKTPGTNNVIGTKKTLVFYKGRVPHTVKTNWVIHEYHAVTFPVDKRTFVLCRLMEKAEKKEKDGTEALVHNEGEPSGHIAAEHENQARADRVPDVPTWPEENLESILRAPPQPDEYEFPSLQQSPIVIEQKPDFQDSTFTDAFFGNGNSIAQFPLESTPTEEEENFVNSILVDEDVFIREERRRALVNESNTSQSPRMAYYESSETHAEAVSAQNGNILDTTSACNEHAGSLGYQSMKMVETSHDAVDDGPPPMSFKNEFNREKKDDTYASGDSTANKPLSICLVESGSSPSPQRASFPLTSRCKTKYHPRSDNFVSQRTAPTRSQTQRKVPSKAASQHEVQKETNILESDKAQRKAHGIRSRKNLEITCNQSLVSMGRILSSTSRNLHYAKTQIHAQHILSMQL